ncbi:MAG: LemA family protein [Bacteroidales bacterium]|jgi:LemA protein|nr:LemA family protein [Bacteroidales bacterium]MDI9552497.1 LemA family protein [Bacteroidota bacterium]HPX44699.1 LemA family protein [Bacteroidales bacterium]HQB87288.1 LemA family protein [Bacteroidales bacterium]
MAIIIIAIVAICGVFLLVVYNRLVRLVNYVREAWSGIDVQLKKRHDLIPLLVTTVKSYASHERNLLEAITKLRTKGMSATSLRETETAEIELSKALGKLFVVVENYPDLKASQNFLELQKDISKVENDLQKARRYYNGTVRNYNILIEQFPSSLVAKLAGHSQKEFFDIGNESERAVPDVNM